MKITKSILKEIIKEEADRYNKKYNLVEMSEEQVKDLLNRYQELVMDIGGIIEEQEGGAYKAEAALSEIKDAIEIESRTRHVPFAQDDDAVYGPFGAVTEKAEVDPEQAEQPEQEEEAMAAVQKVIAYLPGIKTRQAYAQLLQHVLKHQVKDKAMAIKAAAGNKVASVIMSELGEE